MRELIAQAAPGGATGGLFTPFTLLWFGGMFLIVYVLYMRPQQKQRKEREKLLAELKRGDRVLTSGGMYGTVVGVKDDTVVLKIGDDAKAEFRRSAVVSIEKSGE